MLAELRKPYHFLGRLYGKRACWVIYDILRLYTQKLPAVAGIFHSRTCVYVYIYACVRACK
jgi:hypothetical protein